MMQVKVLPIQRQCDSLSDHSEETYHLQAEAGNRARRKLGEKQISLDSLTGRSHGETEV
jgi:hypothetical protein